MYTCIDAADASCPESCVSLDACLDCGCVRIDEDPSGPWGAFMDVFLCLLPVLLLVVTVPTGYMSTTAALPTAAVLLWFVRLAYLGHDALLVQGAVVQGLLEAWTPLSIMAGAIFLFEVMQQTGCLPFLLRQLQKLTAGEPVATLACIFSFGYLLEGCAGFGTPVALGAPLLVRMDHAGAQDCIVSMLLFNTVATVWGAVGTPLWFGLGNVATDDDLLAVSFQSSIAMTVSALVLLPAVAAITVPFATLRRQWLFGLLCILGTILPNLGISAINYEFPSLIGGLVGCAVNALLISYRIGMGAKVENDNPQESSAEQENGTDENDSTQYEDAEETLKASAVNVNKKHPPSLQPSFHSSFGADAPHASERDHDDFVDQTWSSEGPVTFKQLLGRSFPIWGVVLVLALTRIEQIGIKEQLIRKTPAAQVDLGSLGTFKLSPTLVFQLQSILDYPGLNWKYELLYTPFLMPFVLISIITMVIFRQDMQCTTKDVIKTVAERLYNAAIALVGAMILVQLMVKTGETSPAFLIGTTLADWFQQGFVVASPFLGALGSFFSGSTTVSNLTFGRIQQIAAETVGVSPRAFWALQSVGASAGNGICLNNIIAATAVVGVSGTEGVILRKTFKYVALSIVVAIVVMLAIFVRFD